MASAFCSCDEELALLHQGLLELGLLELKEDLLHTHHVGEAWE